ncbi:MAG: hydroxyacylglutathione hydrolase C-terminal domain-containing protein [Steroidobacteraceae bacterium]
MIVERIWTNNNYRNYNYLIACPESGEALAVDPLAHQLCLSRARERGFTITQILNTHEHGDHTGGNRALKAVTGARVLAHAGAAERIGGVDQGLAQGDVIRIGRSVELECLDTPGHTMAHICVLAHSETPALFCGDTLFNAGAGNCHNGGHPVELYQTFARQLNRLPEQTLIYPGHDYLARNLEFTLDREPGNQAAAARVDTARRHDPATAEITTLAVERQINTFFRLGEPQIIARLREQFPDLGASPEAQTVFLKLRELRNRW